LEFPLVFIVGLEEGVFPHSRANESQNDLEEERRLCYVAITRAEKYLYLSHAMRRRVYGEETYSEPSRFLMEFPIELIEDLSKGGSWLRFASRGLTIEDRETSRASIAPSRPATKRTSNYQGQTYNSANSVKEFFARQGKKIDTDAFEPRAISEDASDATGLKVGTRVRHAKYGVGLIVKREGEGEDAKLTINFPGYGHKKMIEKYAALEKA
jgi:DNA helicase-2/ATP-dependent DNA helicase PcrA